MNMTKAIEIIKAEQIHSNQWKEEATEIRENWLWMKYSMQIALKVRSRMKAEGFTQCTLAAKLGCSQQYVSLILKGKENLTLETIAKLESALDISLIGNSTLVDGYRPSLQIRQYLSDNCLSGYECNKSASKKKQKKTQ